MKVSSKIVEEKLHQVWENQKFNKPLRTNSGSIINVLNVGTHNTNNAGPDFKHARIQIDNLIFVGDVEIDNDYSGWKKHAHNINKRYNKVILHVTFSNKQNQHYIYTSEGRKVPTLTLDKFTSEENIKQLSYTEENPKREKKLSLKCAYEVDSIEVEERKRFILGFGIKRFEKKCNRIYTRLRELKYIKELQLNEPVIKYELTKEFNEKEFSHDDFRDKYIWKQVLYEFIFEALGYSQNKVIMLKLAQHLDLKFINKMGYDDNFNLRLESAFFNISGLMPEVESDDSNSSSDYVISLKNEWDKFVEYYDNKKFDETRWHFLGQRPQNFPTIRIAAGVKLTESILYKNFAGQLIKKVSEINNIKTLIGSIRNLLIVKSSGYWKTHYIFEKPAKNNINYFLGLSRADEIFINVLLPYLSVYFDMFGNENLSKKVLRIYNEYEQKLDNKIVRDVSDGLNLPGLNHKTIYMQGMIEVYRNYCSKNKCLECSIGGKVFS
ncbi:MAG: DUF2851 family protein [Ignavibacteriae bacterium]|nr:DUF2851 family protein [Ignavibacteriota bacterium]